MAEASSRNPEGSRKQAAELGDFVGVVPDWTFALVQERLVEAWGFMRRAPTGDRFKPGRAVPSWYHEVDPTAGMTRIELAQWRHRRSLEAPRMPPLSRDEIGRMDEAFGWLEWIAAGEVRQIVGRAIAYLAITEAKRVAWAQLVTGPKGADSADRLRKAYGRAMTDICMRLNAASELG